MNFASTALSVSQITAYVNCRKSLTDAFPLKYWERSFYSVWLYVCFLPPADPRVSEPISSKPFMYSIVSSDQEFFQKWDSIILWGGVAVLHQLNELWNQAAFTHDFTPSTHTPGKEFMPGCLFTWAERNQRGVVLAWQLGWHQTNVHKWAKDSLIFSQPCH